MSNEQVKFEFKNTILPWPVQKDQWFTVIQTPPPKSLFTVNFHSFGDYIILGNAIIVFTKNRCRRDYHIIKHIMNLILYRIKCYCQLKEKLLIEY